jgi:hypothetical protein
MIDVCHCGERGCFLPRHSTATAKKHKQGCLRRLFKRISKIVIMNISCGGWHAIHTSLFSLVGL